MSKLDEPRCDLCRKPIGGKPGIYLVGLFRERRHCPRKHGQMPTLDDLARSVRKKLDEL